MDVDEARGAVDYAARIRRVGDVGFASSVVLLGLVTLAIWLLGRAVDDAQRDRSTLERARATILHLDEVLTMSARMAASTGEARWDERYRANESTLDAAIEQAKALAGPDGRAAAAEIDASNEALVALEHRALDAVRNNREADAAQLLDGDDYERGKAAYAKGLAIFADTLERDASRAATRARNYQHAATLALIFGIAGGLFGWRSFRRATAAVESEYLRAAERARDAARFSRVAMDAAHRQTADLRSIAQELAAVELRERRRLADLLHDDVQQLLAAARLQLAAHGQSSGLELLDEAIRATRTLSHEMSPPLLGTTLAASLEGLTRQFRSRYMLAIELVTAVDPLVPDLVRDVIHTAVRELLFNVAKHAEAQSVTVRLDVDSDRVRVVVEDNGKGFDPAKRDGCGLTGVHDRLVAIGGDADINAAVGRGSRVTLTAPFTPS